MTRTTHVSGNNKENYSIAKDQEEEEEEEKSEWGDEDEKLFFD
jgi:hypothetical protein